MMADPFPSKPDNGDKRYLRWRKISRNLIVELNERIFKRREAISQNDVYEDLSQHTSDEESTSVSKLLSDEYHRKRLAEAELKFKVLEGLDTLSEASSLSSSACFQELEVPEEGDEKSSITGNVNSHNSGADGRPESAASVAYSTSFVESIEEECASNYSDTNAIESPQLHIDAYTNDIVYEHVGAFGNTNREDFKVIADTILDQSTHFNPVENDIEFTDKINDGIFDFQARDDNVDLCSDYEEGLASTHFSDTEIHLEVHKTSECDLIGATLEIDREHSQDNACYENLTKKLLTFSDEIGETGHGKGVFGVNGVSVQNIDNGRRRDAETVPEKPHEKSENDSGSFELTKLINLKNSNFSVDVQCDTKPDISSKETHQESQDISPLNETFKPTKQLDGFDDIHQLFIDQTCDTAPRDTSDIGKGHGTGTDKIVSFDTHDDYSPTLVHPRQRDIQRVLSDMLTDCSMGSKGLNRDDSMFKSALQNISCNKGASSNEFIPDDKIKQRISRNQTRRQTMLKDTLNRPLQVCIEKARIVTSIKETIENSRTMKEKIAGRAAYDNAIREFKEAVDRLLVEQGGEDDHSINASTYSLDDGKVLRKPALNSLDALRTPVNKRRITTPMDTIKKDKIPSITSNDASDLFSQEPLDKTLEFPPLHRTTTYVVLNTKKFDTGGKEDEIIGSNVNTIKPQSTKIDIKPELNTDQEFCEGDDNAATYNAIDSHTGEGKNPRSYKNNHKEAYEPDISPPLDNDKTYDKDEVFGFRDGTDNGVLSQEDTHDDILPEINNDKTFNINKDDKTFALTDRGNIIQHGIKDAEDEVYICNSSDDETLNIVDSFCNVDNESVDLNDILPIDNDERSNTSLASLEDQPVDTFLQTEDIPQTYDPSFQSRYSFERGTEFEGHKSDFIQDLMDEHQNEPTSIFKGELDYNILDLNPVEYENKSWPSESAINLVESYNTSPEILRKLETPTERKSERISEKSNCVTDIPLYEDQTDEKGECLPYEDDIIIQSKLADITNESKSTKVEVSQKESTFSISSSTSGEYSLPINSNQKRCPLSNPCSETFNEVADKTPYGIGEEILPSLEFQLNHPPSELLIRQKSADNIGEICIENPRLFHQLNELPSACVTKHESIVEKDSCNETHQHVPSPDTDNNFVNTLDDLRKTAKNCLGPLRAKVAFFENIEQALLSHDTPKQCLDNVDDHVTQSKPAQLFDVTNDDINKKTKAAKMALTPKASFVDSSRISIPVKDSGVQTDKAPLPENRETQTIVEEGIGNGHQCHISKDMMPTLINLIDDINGRIVESNRMFESLQSSFENAMLKTSLEKEQMKDSLDLLTRRVDSSESVILGKISIVESAVLTAAEDSVSRFKCVSDEFSKLRDVNADRVEELKSFSGEMAMRKEDVDKWGNTITTQFKDHMTTVQNTLDKLHESKPGPSSPPKDNSDTQSSINDLRLKVIEMKNQRDAEKMYHKITRESMRALERDHDRLRQEVLLAATRRHLNDKKKSFRLHSLTEESSFADVDVPSMTSTPRKVLEPQKKHITGIPYSKTDEGKTSKGSDGIKTKSSEQDESDTKSKN